MDTFKCRSIPNNNKSKIARTFQKVINLKTLTRIASNDGIGNRVLTPQNKFEDDGDLSIFHKPEKKGKAGDKRRAVLEALVAKLFAGITTIKAAYAELQTAQHPYNSEAIRATDQAVVEELKQLSELKRSYFKKDVDHLSPKVTIMLAEIQEQQSLMKTYEITIKKLESEFDAKNSALASLKKELDESIAVNMSLEMSLKESGSLPKLDNIHFCVLNPSHFVQFLQYTVRSIRSFVKLMVREMEVAHWDIDAATQAIKPEAILAKPSHKCFVFESFVSKNILEGFNNPNFNTQNESDHVEPHHPENYFTEFKKFKGLNSKHFLTQNPSTSFARFTRNRYLQLVHAKMECSLFGNLNQRKLVTDGGFPDSAFFNAFAEMARRVWTLNLLAFSFGEEVGTFQVAGNCRLSEVYMESVTEESSGSSDADLRVGFTVVPGFKIGKTVIQSQVYLSPVISPASIT